MTGSSLAALVRDRAHASPDAVAVVGPDRTLSYAELDRLARGLAASFVAAGVEPGDRVAIWMRKSAAAIVTMQAALRVGAIYLPIDAEAPEARTAKILADAGARVLVTDADRAIPAAWTETLALIIGAQAERSVSFEAACDSSDSSDTSNTSDEPLAGSGEDIAYILYTSGSTGTPKGVAISHRAALAFVDWSVQRFGVRASDRLSCHAPLHFDLSVFDIYAAFRAGARVCLIPAALAYQPRRLVEFVANHEISVWYSVPSALILMLEHGGLLERELPSLRTVLFAGEPFPLNPLRRLRQRLREVAMFNLYGPTETNVCTAFELDPSEAALERAIPIGQPCCGDEAWAERPDGARAQAGEHGELMVRGPTLMTGYWGHAPIRDEQPYATGDLVRVLADGSFEYLGRRDHLVKIRGHRIEPGEIEAALSEHPSIEAAVVVVVGQSMQAQLLAFIQPIAGQPAPDLLAVKRHCATRLPRSMIVDRVEILESFPRTGNGKTDRARLLALMSTEN